MARKVHWLDSAEVHAQLNAAADGAAAIAGGGRKDAGKKSVALEEPSSSSTADATAGTTDADDDPTPLLIDGEHVAVSLPDMVLVAQSASRSWGSPVPRRRRAARREPEGSRGTDAAVAAVAEHIGGALPSHLGYNRASVTRGGARRRSGE